VARIAGDGRGLCVTLAAQHLYCWLERQHELIVMGRQFVPVPAVKMGFCLSA